MKFQDPFFLRNRIRVFAPTPFLQPVEVRILPNKKKPKEKNKIWWLVGLNIEVSFLFDFKEIL